MEIKLDKKESITLLYSECPMCHKGFNAIKRKKTCHHIIPLLLKPLTDIKMNLCLECHEKLNKLTGQFEVNSVINGKEADNYDIFLKNYTELRDEYNAKRINRGQFGEGLWSNLVSFLGSLNAEVTKGK